VAQWLAAVRRGQPLRLTLCGEAASATFGARPARPWALLRQRWLPGGRLCVPALLETL
jgi:hypothetical protein